MSLGHSSIASVQLDASELGEDYEDEISSASKRHPRRSFTETEVTHQLVSIIAASVSVCLLRLTLALG